MTTASLEKRNGALPILLQSALNTSVNSYLGSQISPMNGMSRVVSSTQNSSPSPLNEEVKAKLISSFAEAYIKDWNVPTLTAPLSEQTLRFLQNHSVEELMAYIPRASQDNPLLSFCLDILQSTVSQIATHAITDYLSKEPDLPSTKTSEETQEKALDKNFTFQRGPLLASNGAIMFDFDTSMLAGQPASNIDHEINLFTNQQDGQYGGENEAIHYANQGGLVYDYEATFLPDYTPSDLYSGSHDPSVNTMQKIASQDVQRLIKKGITEEVKSHLTEIGEATAIDRVYRSLGEGNNWLQAAEVGVEAAHANQKFLQYAGRVISTAATTGVFLTKVEEMGLRGASAEMAKNVAIGFFSKYSSKIVTTFVGCAHPVWCAGVLTTIIADTFSVTETAPPERDMLMRPLPPPSLENIIRSRLPPLDPPYPTLRSLDNYRYTQ